MLLLAACMKVTISIHALLAESDAKNPMISID